MITAFLQRFATDIPPLAQKKLAQHRYRADRIMLFLLIMQWFLATFVTSLTYGTYGLGFIGGGIIVASVYFGLRHYQGTRTMRALVATAMMLFSVIYIQQHYGRIEMHFHVFIALALLTLYREIFPIVVATAVTIGHHLLFNYLQLLEINFFGTPVMVFNYGCGLDIVLLHGAFVLLEALALSYIARLQIEHSVLLVASERRAATLAKQFEQFAHGLDESAIVSKSDPSGNITYVNQMFCTVSGYAREELLGKPHSVIRHGDMPDSFFKELWKTIQRKEVFKGIIKNRKKNGDAYYVESVIIPILDINGDISEFLAVRYDVTELIETRDKALAAQRAKDQFLANMSHELRTPLNAILGFTQLLQKKVTDETAGRYLGIVMESSNKLLHLINDILDLAKIQSGKFTLHPEPFRFNEELRLLMESFEKIAEEKQQHFTHHIDITLADSFIGDWKRISQVISNLLSNAFKFTPDSGSITLDATYSGGMVRIRVADTGIGLTPEAKERIFNPFEQADGSTTRQYGGTGLGLSITRELVTMMEGRIEVESTEGEGSTFTLVLPLRSQNTPAPQDATCPTEEPEARERLDGEVLVAEDNRSNQMLIQLMLEEIGLRCDIAADGREAVRLYGEKPYDLVLMDENMPNMSGIEAFEELKRLHGRLVPVIALTANVMKGDRERFIEAGMDDFIGKPVNAEQLYTVLKKHLSLQRQHGE